MSTDERQSELLRDRPKSFKLPPDLDLAQSKILVLETMLEDMAKDLYLERRELEIANKDLTSVLETMPNAVLATDSEYRIRIANSASLKVLGYDPEELHGVPLGSILSFPWIREAIEAGAPPSSSRGESEELFYNPETGETVTLLVSCTSLPGDEGRGSGMLCLCSDISGRKALEQDLLQAQKLESIGTLAAGIAHELNTPIQYVRDNIVFLTDEFPQLIRFIEGSCVLIDQCSRTSPPGSHAQALAVLREQIDLSYLIEQIPLALKQTREGAEAVAKIVRSMKEFSHPGTEAKQAVDLNASLQSTATVSKNEWKYFADLDMHLDANLPSVLCYPGELNQVILNLIVNAAHAIEESQRERASAAKGRIRITSSLEGESVVITVSDTGKGIPENIRSMIFDPFFTTKPVGKGTGQGLTLARRIIVERHGGSIAVESEVGVGSTFMISIPING